MLRTASLGWAKGRAGALTAILLLASLGPLGCVVAWIGGTAAALGGIAYVRGELRAPLGGSVDRVWASTLTAMDDLELPALVSRKDGISASYETSTATGRKISVHLTRVSDAITDVRIRIGLFGDETFSRYILDRIQREVSPPTHAAASSRLDTRSGP